MNVNLQMGSHMKKAIFEEQTTKALKKWQKVAKEKRKLRKAGIDIPSRSSVSVSMSGETTPSQGSSPLHLLHKYNKPSHIDSADLYSPRSYQSDTEFSETEGSTHELNEIKPTHQAPRKEETHNIDFSFDKP